jgi:hypothetical protein
MKKLIKTVVKGKICAKIAVFSNKWPVVESFTTM